MLRTRLSLLVLLAATPLVSGCAGDAPTVALLVADADTSSRAVDVDAFTERVEATCDECEVSVYHAGGDAAEQRSQARQAEAGPADVLVVVPVDAEEMASATGRDLPVVSLGELVPGSDSFVGLEGGPPPEGDASDLEAARDLVLGEEQSTTFVPTQAMSEQAADVALSFLSGEPVPGGQDVDGVESWLYRDQEVTVDTLTSVLVAEGVITLDELCTGSTEKRCTRMGLL
jgi:ABC-type xylose transport system substrate-binding protein